MPKYKIADVVVEMDQDYKETAHWYSDYIYNGDEEAAFAIKAPQTDIDYFVEVGKDITPAVAENMVLCNIFNRRLLRYGGSYLHSSALLYENKVYLFSAGSGVGKSTHTKKWLDRFPQKASVINDDKPSFRIIDGKCIVYGTPFSGGTNLQINTSAELGAIVFIERAEENSLTKLNASQAINLMISQAPKIFTEKAGEIQLDLYSQILTSYPVYLLKCNMDDSALDVSMGILTS